MEVGFELQALAEEGQDFDIASVVACSMLDSIRNEHVFS